MSVARPPDFEPLADSDPVPGDPDEISRLGRRYADTATEIARQAGNLHKLASATPDGWEGLAGPVFRSKASDLAGRISAAHDRYATTGKALQHAAPDMAEHQEDAYQAVYAAKAAAQQMAASLPAPPPPAGSPPPPPLTPQQNADAEAKSRQFTAAQHAVSTARTKFNAAVDGYTKAAARAAAAISGAISNDGVHDNWWQRNFHWLSKVFKIVAIVIVVLAVVAILIAVPATAGLLAALPFVTEAGLATAGTVVEVLGTALTVGQSAFDGISAGEGMSDWTSFALDLVGLATFGLGKAAGGMAEGLTGWAESAGSSIAAGRAGRAAMPTGLGLLYSLGLGGRFAGVTEAADRAAAGVKAMTAGAEATNATSLWNMSSEISESLSKLNRLGDEFPTSIRITAAQMASHGLSNANGALQWASYLKGTQDAIANALPQSDPKLPAIGQFRLALAHVP
jgi:uncharacterized protein YukE